jgi:NAD(P)-dependent dehydrogenase (short-subunit alcohol dehydrogenase family)
MGLSGKVAVITGGANGIGRATALRLAAEGTAVVVADRDVDGARAVVEQLDVAGLALGFDAADVGSVEEVVNAAVKEFGRVDVLHNNVGVTSAAWSTDLTVLETPAEVWDMIMAVNVRSHFVAAKAALPHMLAAGGGSIVNMASVAGQRGRIGLTAYGASKAAVIQLTRSLATQYGRSNVRANCISPGVILTEQLRANAPDLEGATLQQLPFPRVGLPEDVAALVAFLASDEAGFINGEVIRCDGGGSIGSDPRSHTDAHPDEHTAHAGG